MKNIKKKILIVEDSEYYMNLVTDSLINIENTILYKAENISEAYRIAMEKNIDVFIVDVVLDTKVLGGVSGIVFVDRIRTVPRYRFSPIIITSSLEDPKYHAYNYLHCFRYFEKTYDVSELAETVKEALEFKQSEDIEKIIYYKRQGILFSLRTKDIVYVENHNKYIVYCCRDGKYKAPYKSCKKIVEDIASKDFIQCNKNTVVNRQYIHNIDGTNRYITLVENRGKLEIGPRLKKEFLRRLEND